MRRLITGFVLSMACLIAVQPLAAADWGDITGTFIYDGTPPTPSKLVITKDQAVCGKAGLVDETVTCGPNKGIKNIVIYMYLKRGAKKPPVHDMYAATANAEVKIDNDKCRFEPRIVLLRTSQTLAIGNKDSVGHNAQLLTQNTPSVNPLIPAGATFRHKCPAEERLPAEVKCGIHPWMKAYVVVKENPYFAVTDENGKFTIKNVPAGEWTFQVWHETGYVSMGKSSSKTADWQKRGRFEINVKSGTNDIGTVMVPPDDLK